MMMDALSKASTRGDMIFDFESNGMWGGLSAARATQLVSNIPLTAETFVIRNAKYGSKFMEAVIKRVNQFNNLKVLRIWNTVVGGKEKGLEVGLRLAKIMSTNTTIKLLFLCNTNLIGVDNARKWGDALMINNTLTKLILSGVGEEIVEGLMAKTKNRSLKLEIETGRIVRKKSPRVDFGPSTQRIHTSTINQ